MKHSILELISRSKSSELLYKKQIRNNHIAKYCAITILTIFIFFLLLPINWEMRVITITIFFYSTSAKFLVHYNNNNMLDEILIATAKYLRCESKELQMNAQRNLVDFICVNSIQCSIFHLFRRNLCVEIYRISFVFWPQ